MIGRGFSRGIDYEREKGRVKVSIKEVVPDIIFPRLSLAIEVKLCRDQSKARRIVDEINADIQAYEKGIQQYCLWYMTLAVFGTRWNLSKD